MLHFQTECSKRQYARSQDEHTGESKHAPLPLQEPAGPHDADNSDYVSSLKKPSNKSRERPMAPFHRKVSSLQRLGPILESDLIILILHPSSSP